LDIDYQEKLNQFRQLIPRDLHNYQYNHFILRDGVFVGSLMNIINVAMSEFNIHDAEIVNTKLFDTESNNYISNLLRDRGGRPLVYMELVTEAGNDKEYFGKLIIELFDDICPMACQNFINLCTGERGSDVDGVKLSYRNCPIHRIVPSGWIQTGDIVNGSGNNSRSSYGKNIEDESFSVEFNDARGGVLGYASSGPHTNGSQFFITLGPCDWMNCTKVGFGQVIQGYDVLHRLDTNTPCKNQRPIKKILIDACGRVR
jgi:cyclophilin family peptidyl-prolyl cis-trans isomerase